MRKLIQLASVVLATGLGISCSNGGYSADDNTMYRSLIKDAIMRQARMSRTEASAVRSSQRPVVFDQYPTICILLVRGDLAESQRCYRRVGSSWVLAQEAVGPVPLSSK